MPWNNQSGGGGGPWGGGGNSGGPWGQGPRGPSGPQGSPPDLEDIIRRGQDRLKRVLPGGGRASPALFGLIALCRAGVLAVPGGLHRAARRSGGRTAVRQAEERALRAGPALPLVADRNGRDRQHRRKAGRHRRRHPRSRQFRPDAVGRPEHRRRAVFRRLPGLRSEGLSVQRCRSRRRWCARSPKAPCARRSAAARRRTFSATTGRASPTRCAASSRQRSIATAPACRSTPSRSRTRRRRAKWPTPSTRCSAPSRTKTVSSRKPTSIPTRSSARRAARRRRSAKRRPPTRTASCRRRKARRSASSRSTTNTPRRRT